MSERVRQLAERQAQLQARSAAQRAVVAAEVGRLEARFAGVDRVAGLARRVLVNPIVIGGGIVALLTVGRMRGVRLIGRLFLLSTAVRQLVQTLKLFKGLTRTNTKTGGGGE